MSMPGIGATIGCGLAFRKFGGGLRVFWSIRHGVAKQPAQMGKAFPSFAVWKQGEIRLYGNQVLGEKRVPRPGEQSLTDFSGALS